MEIFKFNNKFKFNISPLKTKFMKSALIFFLYSFIPFFLSAQNQTSAVIFKNDMTIIHPIYFKDSTRAEKIELTFYRNSAPDSGTVDTVVLKMENYRFFKPSFISSPTIIVKNWDVVKDSSNTTISHKETIYVTNKNIPDSINLDAISYIKIEGDKTNTSHEIRLTEKGLYNSASNFWMEAGANFDLLEGVTANNLYGGIYMFEKDIVKVGNKPKVSFTGGYMNQNHQVLQEDLIAD